MGSALFATSGGGSGKSGTKRAPRWRRAATARRSTGNLFDSPRTELEDQGRGRRARQTGVRMIRVAAWTGGLFAVGYGICHLFPGPFIEPLVLIALGTILFLVSGRAASTQRQEEPAHATGGVASTRAAR
jgi:hypothetical protein